MSTEVDKKNQIDAMLTYIFLQRLLRPIRQTEAYKKGIVDDQGKVINKEESKSISILDKLIFKIKRLLGGRLSSFNKFMYVKTLGYDFTDHLMPRGGVSNRAEIKRLKRDLEKLNEKHNISDLNEMFVMLLNEEIINMTDHNGYIKESYFK